MHSEGASPLPGAMHINEFLGRIDLNVNREPIQVYGNPEVNYSFTLVGERIHQTTGKFVQGVIDSTSLTSHDRLPGVYFSFYEKMCNLRQRDDHRNMKIRIQAHIPFDVPPSVVGMADSD